MSFIWLAGRHPCIVLPSSKIVTLDVDGNIPYLRADGLHTTLTTSDEIMHNTGVYVEDGKSCIQDDELAAPALSQETSKADESKDKRYRDDYRDPDASGSGSSDGSRVSKLAVFDPLKEILVLRGIFLWVKVGFEFGFEFRSFQFLV